MIDIEKLYGMTIEELWEAYNQTIAEDPDNFKETTTKIKEGINIKIPIEYFTKKYYTENPSNKNVNILGYGKVPITKFWEEETDRKTIMRQTIIEENEELDMVKAR